MITRAELVEKYTRLARDTVPGALLPASEVYRRIINELNELSLADNQIELTYEVETAAPMCGVRQKTLSNWLSEDSKRPKTARRFPNAFKSSEGKGGKWAIPATDITAYQERRREEAA